MQIHTIDPPVPQFVVRRAHGRVVEIDTSDPDVAHFLRLVRLTRSYYTWVNYAHDLRTFFSVVHVAPAAVDRAVCGTFIEHQLAQGRSVATINRRLAALSSLFTELNLLDPVRFSHNPVYPIKDRSRAQRARLGLYRTQAQRIPDVLTPAQVQTLLTCLPTWRDRTLVLLMCMSCLRVSEAVAVEFEHIECSRRSVFIPAGKGALARTAYMDRTTFAALNSYLDQERGSLFPDQPALFIAFKGPARGRPISVNAVQHLVRYYAQQCGVRHVHPHRFRHTGITWLVQAGMAEAAVRVLVGHRNAHSLEPYLHLHSTFVQTDLNGRHPHSNWGGSTCRHRRCGHDSWTWYGNHRCNHLCSVHAVFARRWLPP